MFLLRKKFNKNGKYFSFLRDKLNLVLTGCGILVLLVLFSNTSIFKKEDFGNSYIDYIFIVVIIFLLCREIMCWYWKINLSISKYDEIIGLLKEIRDKMEPRC